MEREDNTDAQCIGNLEHHLHQLFSSVRVPGDDFVYSTSQDMYSVMDEYCEESTFHEPRPPLMFLDESGSGKSALLSNWLQKKHKKQAQGRKGDEFIFWHAVGCSRQSMNVNSLIRRLMHDLKSRFDLGRDVPIAQDRLSWELPRFFEMASKRGRLIIVIDGIHRLVTNEDAEAGLAWLPLEFPANVRIILTATESKESMANNGDSLDRLSVTPSLIRTVTNGSSSEQKATDFFGDLPSVDEAGSTVSQQRGVLIKGGKILAELKRRKWRPVRVKRMDRSQCRNVVDTYILSSVQKETMDYTTGPFLTHLPDENADKEVPPLDSAPGYLLFDIQIAKLLSHPMGGTPMFLRLFLQCSHYAVKRGFSLWQLWDNWLACDSVAGLLNRILRTIESGHLPNSATIKADRAQTEGAGALQTLRILYPWHPSFQDDDFLDMLNQDSTEQHVEARIIPKTEEQHDDEDDGNMPLSVKVTENFGDQQWLALGGFAESVLKRTKVQINNSLMAAVQNAQAMASMEIHQSTSIQPSAELTGAKSRVVSASAIAAQKQELPSNMSLQVLEAALKAVNEALFTETLNQIQGTTTKAVNEEQTRGGADANEDQGEDVEAGEAATESKQPELEPEFEPEPAPAPKNSNKTAGIETLPMYLLGGTHVSGLGKILGNALSLLYVARHGLKESEIWGLLASLHRQEHQAEMNKLSEEFADGSYSGPDNGETQAIVQICYTARGMLEDLCRSEDLAHGGKITRAALTKVLHTLHQGLSFTDMVRLLEITSLMTEDPTILSADIQVDYKELLQRVAKVYEKNSRKGESAISSFENITSANRSIHENSYSIKNKNHSRDENFAAGMSQDNTSAQPESMAQASDVSLGPVLEESLLNVLIALGVLHSPENHVLVLPSDNDVLRDFVNREFVQARGGESVWHGHLIRHFQKERNSMRRCEELPWHLQLCRRWHAMKDALVDLSTFEMMYDSSDLRDEFMSYWVQLTEGPMYITDELHKTAVMTQQKQVEEVLRGDRGRDPELAKILIRLDTASALNLTEKNAKKLLIQNQVHTFDVIEEFNKSLEMWVHKSKPSLLEINTKVLHIAKFLAEFSLKGAAQPPFLRLGIEMRALQLFDIPFDSFKEVMTEEVLDDTKPLAIENGKDEEEDSEKVSEFFPAARHLKGGNIYFYLRWMWIQFPWIALNNTVEVGSVCEVGGLASVLAAYAAGARGRGRSGPPHAAVASADDMGYEVETAGPGSGNVSVGANQKHLAIARSTRLWDVKKNDPSKPVFENTMSRKSASVKSVLVSSKVQDVMDMNIRKVRDDIANASAAKNKMPAKFRRTMEQELEAMKGIPHAQHCKRSLSRNTLFPSLDAHIKEKNRLIEEDGELYANALATMRLGGPGLALAAGLESDIKALAEKEQMDAWNQRRGGALPVGSERELEHEREFERMIRLRSMANRTTTLLRERTALHEKMQQEAASRDVQDEEIQQFMYSGEEAIKQLKEKYQVMTDALDEGKRLNNGYLLLIEWLQYTPPFSENHVQSQQAQVLLAKQQLADVQKLRHTMYMQAEREALVKQKQVLTKVEYFREARSNVAAKRAKLFPDLKPFGDDDGKGRSRLGRKSRNAVLGPSSVLDALQETSIASAIEKGSTMALLTSGDNVGSVSEDINNLSEGAAQNAAEEVIKSMKKETVKERAKRLKKERDEEAKIHQEFRFDKESLQHSIIQALFKPDHEKVREMEAHAKTMQSTMMWEYVMEKTGSSNEDELIERFQDSKKLTDSLLAQQNLVDSRLAQLRTLNDEVKQQLSQSILMGGDEGNEEEETDADGNILPDSETGTKVDDDEDDSFPESQNDARFFENKLFSTEMHLAQIQRQVELSINKINEVRTGVGHIMNLLTMNHRMLHNLPKSIPPQLKNHDDIISSLSWCEERILAINEAQMVDSSHAKGGGAAASEDSSKPLFARQTDLAVAVQSMFDKQSSGTSRRAVKRTKAAKIKGGMSEMLINSQDAESNVNSPRGVVVPARTDVDKLNDLEVEKIQKTRDRHAENFEAQQLEAKIGTSGAGVQKFLTEALSTESQVLLRKTNLALQTRKGRNAGYGYVLDEFLEKAGLPIRLDGTEATPLSLPVEEMLKKKNSSPKKKEENEVVDDD